MNPDLFQADLEDKPRALAQLSALLQEASPWADAGIDRESRLVMLGMGSSHYANAVAAARLRARGVDAVAELASNDLLPPARPGTVVVAVSASGGSAETLAAVERYEGTPVVALTNVADSALVGRARHAVTMEAGLERGGVACRSFQHTLALWLDLEARLCGSGDGAAALVERAAVACDDLLARRHEWLPQLDEHALGPDGTHLVAPARRMCSAQQGALMLREGPRLPAVGCETGDWSHVDVYLTKTSDYRLVLFAGSRWEPELLRWVRERSTRLVVVGGSAEGSALDVRYEGDDDDDVRLLSEVLVAELLSARAWSR